ncbi:hypothetical protein BT67DRAFT_448271 [Trichocladium antarcticum]|uniref:Woronin body major protein n=1 Tax=Trichocladium antarcticum TaxID=1450529 RepID=A0AAN6UQJ9_9PEZI|nr:hypothetical protein BT67DRAFT_448271 [Trichocladium antarcticum]
MASQPADFHAGPGGWPTTPSHLSRLSSLSGAAGKLVLQLTRRDLWLAEGLAAARSARAPSNCEEPAYQLALSLIRGLPIRPGKTTARGFVNLDFEARVPVPFSVFPSSYRESETATQTHTHTHEELEIKLPHAGQEGQHSSSQAPPARPPPEEGRFKEEEVRITREEEHHHHRPPPREEFRFREERRPHQSSYAESRIEIDRTHRHHNTAVDVAESEYRSRTQPNYRKEYSVASSTLDGPGFSPSSKASSHSHYDEYTVDGRSSRPVYKESVHVSGTTVDTPAPRSTYHKEVNIVEETVDAARSVAPPRKTSSKMGYYDEDGHYHSFRQGLHKFADRIAHPQGHDRADVSEVRRPRGSSEGSSAPNTVTIPCHHIRLGDILILQGRPCQVIRISTSAATGQHRYLGVDLFTKQLHEESSFVSNPAPSVVVQTMLGPVFKQYRVLDMQDGTIVAMTETGDVKQNLSVIDQSSLWNRLQKAFESGRGSVRVLVVTDHGREMAVDMKVVHGSRL